MSHLMQDSRERFGDRVEVYRRHRPGWPAMLAGLLREQGVLRELSVVADIGSGTGLSCRPFLLVGHEVRAVEPNAGMRHAAESLLGSRPSFRSLPGSAEATGLADHSVDLVVAGQAFHWFDLEASRKEFQRILKPPAPVLLMWNLRDTTSTPFDRDYELFLEHWGIDYGAVREHHPTDDVLRDFMGRQRILRYRLPNPQALNREGLKGRLASASYLPGPGHPQHASMQDAAGQLFDAHQQSGLVTLSQHCELFRGFLSR